MAVQAEIERKLNLLWDAVLKLSPETVSASSAPQGAQVAAAILARYAAPLQQLHTSLSRAQTEIQAAKDARQTFERKAAKGQKVLQDELRALKEKEARFCAHMDGVVGLKAPGQSTWAKTNGGRGDQVVANDGEDEELDVGPEQPTAGAPVDATMGAGLDSQLEEAAAQLSEGEVGVLEAAVAKGSKVALGGEQAAAVGLIIQKARELGALKAKLVEARDEFRQEEGLLSAAEKAAEGIARDIEKARVRAILCDATKEQLEAGWKQFQAEAAAANVAAVVASVPFSSALN